MLNVMFDNEKKDDVWRYSIDKCSAHYIQEVYSCLVEITVNKSMPASKRNYINDLDSNFNELFISEMTNGRDSISCAGRGFSNGWEVNNGQCVDRH